MSEEHRITHDTDHENVEDVRPLQQFVCPICGAVYTHAGALEEHVMNVHEGGRPGDVPGQGYTSGQSITRGAAGPDPNSGSVDDPGYKGAETGPQFTCQFCGSVFDTEAAREAHVESQHRTPAADRLEPEPASLDQISVKPYEQMPADPPGEPAETVDTSAGSEAEEGQGRRAAAKAPKPPEGGSRRRRGKRRPDERASGSAKATGRKQRDAGTGVGSGGGAGGRGVTG